MAGIEVTGVDIDLVPPPEDGARDCLAWAVVTFDHALAVGAFCVRRRPDGRLRVAFPTRPRNTHCGRCGHKTPVTVPRCGFCGCRIPPGKEPFRPLAAATPVAHAAIEAAVLHAYVEATTTTPHAKAS